MDRSAFFGRNGNLAQPVALLDPTYPFANSANATLDPCAAIVLTLDIPPRQTVQCAFLSAVGSSRAAVVNALQPFQSFERIDWAFESSRLQSERELTGMRIDSETVRRSYELLPKILWPHNLAHIPNDAFTELRRVQDSLWRHGISGDRPIVTLRVDGEEDLKAAATLLKSLRYLSRKGFAVDAIFLDETKGGYAAPINDRLHEIVNDNLAPGRERTGSAAFIVPARNLAAGEQTALIAAARMFMLNKS